MKLISWKVAIVATIAISIIAALITSSHTTVDLVRCFAIGEGLTAAAAVYTSGIYRANLAKFRRDKMIIGLKEMVFVGLCLLQVTDVVDKLHTPTFTAFVTPAALFIFTVLLIATSIYTEHQRTCG